MVFTHFMCSFIFSVQIEMTDVHHLWDLRTPEKEILTKTTFDSHSPQLSPSHFGEPKAANGHPGSMAPWAASTCKTGLLLLYLLPGQQCYVTGLPKCLFNSAFSSKFNILASVTVFDYPQCGEFFLTSSWIFPSCKSCLSTLAPWLCDFGDQSHVVHKSPLGNARQATRSTSSPYWSNSSPSRRSNVICSKVLWRLFARLLFVQGGSPAQSTAQTKSFPLPWCCAAAAVAASTMWLDFISQGHTADSCSTWCSSGPPTLLYRPLRECCAWESSTSHAALGLQTLLFQGDNLSRGLQPLCSTSSPAFLLGCRPLPTQRRTVAFHYLLPVVQAPACSLRSYLAENHILQKYKIYRGFLCPSWHLESILMLSCSCLMICHSLPLPLPVLYKAESPLSAGVLCWMSGPGMGPGAWSQDGLSLSYDALDFWDQAWRTWEEE